MARYSTNVRTDTNKINVKTVKYNVDINTNDYKVSLSRVGAHGSKGDSVTRAYFDSNNHLLLEISNAQGNVVSTIDAGSMTNNFDVNDLSQFDLSIVEDGDVLVLNGRLNETQSSALLADVDCCHPVFYAREARDGLIQICDLHVSDEKNIDFTLPRNTAYFIQV